MEKVYDPKTIEPKWRQFWEAHHYAEPNGDGEPYCIMLPPPNINGRLHMGHGFQQTLMDAMIRHARMQGKKTLWQGGTDHASIATQIVVERKLNAEGLSRHDLGRDAFVERVWQWRSELGSNITDQIRRLGASIDWQRERFTMDESISHATLHAFVTLYREGLIYRGKRLVNWDPVLNTAISDLEVLNAEEQGSLWHIRYPVQDSDESLVVATTRPETMLGDVAVAVHPEDERYQHLIGQQVRLPLCDRLIPIIADEYVDREFGTGCVKITPAHDFNDYEVGHRHHLNPISIMNFDATINDQAPEPYRGLDRFAAREKVVADLTNLGLLVKTEPHTLNVPYGDRSQAVIEPLLTDQWFMKTDLVAKEAIKAVENGDLQFIPENWGKTYTQWLENIQDWCLSRQLWWGHRIPAWYDNNGGVYVGYDEADVRKQYNLGDEQPLTQDNDVLDTWFSAALWPFATLGWPEETPDLKTFYPTQVLVTGFDIIFFWVVRMVMMGLKFTGQVPFRQVYITGLVRDAHGQKMSKSKGNVLDPIDLVDGISLDDLIAQRTQNLMQPHMLDSIIKNTKKDFPNGIAAFGTDALRFTFCALATTGRNINFDMGRIEGYRNFCNKLWNATRFVLMQCENQTIARAANETHVIHHWIQVRLNQLISEVEQHFQNYRFDLLANCLYEFIWNEYCDWYLEFCKCLLQDANTSDAIKAHTRYELLHVLETTLRLLHPLMPFITEELWQRIKPLLSINIESLMIAPYPQAATLDDTTVINDIDWLKQLINSIRNVRGEMNISPAKSIQLILQQGTAHDQARVTQLQSLICQLTKADSCQWHSDEDLSQTASVLIGDLRIDIPLAGLIDVAEEQKRLEKLIEKLSKEQAKLAGMLNNPNFVANAPEAVVSKQRAQLADIEKQLASAQAQLAKMA